MRCLIVKTSSLGDMVYTLPIVSDMMRAYPDAAIDWLSEKSFAAIPLLHSGVRSVIPLQWRDWRKQLFSRQTWQAMRQHVQQLRTHTYDCIIDTQELIKSAVMARLARGRVIAGQRYPRESIARYAYHQRYSIPHNLHVVDRHRWLCAAIFGYTLDHPADFGITHLLPSVPAAEALIAQHPSARGYVMIIQGASTSTKYWSIEHWRTVCQWCTQQQWVCLLPWGSPAEYDRACVLSADLPMVYPAPPLTIPECATLLAHATVVIGQDTGFTHLAAALKRPTIALYLKDVIQTHGAYTTDTDDHIVSLGGTYIPTSEEVITLLSQWSSVLSEPTSPAITRPSYEI